MTSIEWLLEELKKVHYPTEAMIMYAKKLEKQQIIDAINDVSQNNVMYANKIVSSILPIEGELFTHNEKLAEQYYKEKFKKND